MKGPNATTLTFKRWGLHIELRDYPAYRSPDRLEIKDRVTLIKTSILSSVATEVVKLI